VNLLCILFGLLGSIISIVYRAVQSFISIFVWHINVNVLYICQSSKGHSSLYFVWPFRVKNCIFYVIIPTLSTLLTPYSEDKAVFQRERYLTYFTMHWEGYKIHHNFFKNIYRILLSKLKIP
jgi:hypothetical protein